MSELLHFSPKGLSFSEVVMNCKSSECFAWRKDQIQASQISQWTRVNGMTFLEVLLLGISYVVMVSMIIVCDLAALVVWSWNGECILNLSNE